MNRTKLGFFVLIFLFGATLLVPVLLTGIASASCGAYARDYDRCAVRDYDRCAVRDYNRTAVRDCDRCVDRCAYDGDLLRCDSGAVRDYDRGAAGYCENCASEYRCNLYGCAWGR